MAPLKIEFIQRIEVLSFMLATSLAKSEKDTLTFPVTVELYLILDMPWLSSTICLNVLNSHRIREIQLLSSVEDLW